MSADLEKLLAEIRGAVARDRRAKELNAELPEDQRAMLKTKGMI